MTQASSNPSPKGTTLKGQVALVTGGGSGIGLACAARLARDGAIVVLAGRTDAKLATAAGALRAEGFVVQTVICDVTDEDSVAMACGTAATIGNLTMVVANAGTGAASPLHLTSLDEWNNVLATNLTGTFLTIKHATPHLAENGGGSIVAISSIAAPLTHRYMAAYSVSKAAVEMLVKQAADELGTVNIRANAVRPGLVPTDISVGLTSVPSIVDDYLDQMPLHRLGTVDDIAEAVRYLLGPESRWVTGQCIAVDGGHTLRRGPNLTPLMEMALGAAAHPASPK
jgi:NAD(P)-dependent dehydrogenase (short-subunit alcohol dehydrogenase family)